MKIIEDYEWILPHKDAAEVVREVRKYIVCTKCGYKRKISRR